MLTKQITLNNIREVEDFVRLAVDANFKVNLKNDKYIVNGKSIMGIFSLDLSKPIKVEVHCDDCSEFEKEIERFTK